MQDQPYGLRVLGKIVNVLADEKVLDEAGKIDAGKLNAFAFDQMRNGYYALGRKGRTGLEERRGAHEKVIRTKPRLFVKAFPPVFPDGKRCGGG